jgi:hypothetical protein
MADIKIVIEANFSTDLFVSKNSPLKDKVNVYNEFRLNPEKFLKSHPHLFKVTKTLNTKFEENG